MIYLTAEKLTGIAAIPAGEKKNRIDRIACGSRIKKDGELLSYFSFNVVDLAAEGGVKQIA